MVHSFDGLGLHQLHKLHVPHLAIVVPVQCLGQLPHFRRIQAHTQLAQPLLELLVVHAASAIWIQLREHTLLGT